jgi:hypothetical protein
MPGMTRREFAGLSALAAAAIAAPRLSAQEAAQQAAQQEEKLQSAYLADLVIQTDPPHDAGAGHGGKLIVPVADGTIESPRFKGKLVRPSGDWITERPDGSRVLDVRLLVQTDDDQFIYISWRGVAYTPAHGGIVARIAPVFETGAQKYAWLNNVIAVGVLRSIPGKIACRLYEIL